MSRLACCQTLLGLLCLVAAEGCGGASGEERLSVFPVSGMVSVDGRPVKGVQVVLHPAEGTAAAKAGVLPSARTQPDGTFQLSSYDQHDGAPAGKYTVTVRWYQPTPAAAQGPKAIPGFAHPTDRFRGKYNNPQTSPWPVTITEGNNVLKRFEVQGVAGQTVVGRRR